MGDTATDAASPPPDQARSACTATQGQYPAFICYYTKILGRSPSEADMQGYLRVSPPSVHQMVLSLQELGFIDRTPGQNRSLKLLLSRAPRRRRLCVRGADMDHWLSTIWAGLLCPHLRAGA